VNPNRRNYHHGDLANALTAAATQLARDGGPEAVVLREAARKVGVSATAAYRHFAGHGELIHAVKDHAGEQLAASMRTELARTEPCPDPGDEALRRLRALGIGYLRFALAEPGLFRTAFCRADIYAGHPGGAQDADMMASPAYQMQQAQVLGDVIRALAGSPHASLLIPSWVETNSTFGPNRKQIADDMRRSTGQPTAGDRQGAQQWQAMQQEVAMKNAQLQQANMEAEVQKKAAEASKATADVHKTQADTLATLQQVAAGTAANEEQLIEESLAEALGA